MHDVAAKMANVCVVVVVLAFLVTDSTAATKYTDKQKVCRFWQRLWILFVVCRIWLMWLFVGVPTLLSVIIFDVDSNITYHVLPPFSFW